MKFLRSPNLDVLREGANPERSAAAIAAVFLANYFFWLVFPGSPLPSICIIMAMVLVVAYLSLELRQRRYLLPLVIGVGLAVLFFAPPTDWDARSIWFLHAKRMYFDTSLVARLDNYPLGTHPSYPDFVPAAAASIARLFGVWNEFLPKTALVLTLVPPFVVLMSRCNSLVIRLLMLGSLLYLTRTQLLSGSMDAHLSIYVVAVIVLLREAAENVGRGQGIVPIIILLCAAAGIKNEGAAMAAILVLPLLVVVLRIRGSAALARFTATGLFASLPLLVWKFQTQAAGIDNGLLSGDPWGRVVTRLTSGEFVQILQTLWNAVFVPVVLLLLVAILLRKANGLAMWFIGLYSAVMFAVYLVTPYDLVWHMSSSVGRVTLVIKLVAAAIAILELGILLAVASVRPPVAMSKG